LDFHHLALVILALTVVILLLGIGRGGGSLMVTLLKKLVKGTDVNINVGEADVGKTSEVPGACILIDPSRCVAHEAEKERSMRNEAAISELKADLKTTRQQLFGKLETLESMLGDIKVAIAKLVVEGDYRNGRKQL